MEFIEGIDTSRVVRINLDAAELSMWKQVLPAWVERCRTDWSHGDGCEYRTTGRISPTDQPSHFLCSCGQGLFSGDFQLGDVPRWLSLAISHVFWAPFADEVYRPPTGNLGGREAPSAGCHICGARAAEAGCWVADEVWKMSAGRALLSGVPEE